MDEEEVKNLVSEARKAYNSDERSIQPLMAWRDRFKEAREYGVVNVIYKVIIKRHGKQSTFMPEIDDYRQEGILEEVLSNNLVQLILS